MRVVVSFGANGRWLANWYPQMGGYTSKCWVSIDGQEQCFDAFVWHNGEFPFDDGDGTDDANHIHHCNAQQFVDFGTAILDAKKAANLNVGEPDQFGGTR